MEIDPTTPSPNSLEQAQSDFSTSTTTLQQAGLDRDAFLTIFLAQLENQDPLSPQDASELGAQLATFSQLEQSVTMAQELAGVNERLDKLIDATGSKTGTSLDPVALIGKQVEVLNDRITPTTGGDSARLNATVSDSGGEFLLIEAFDDAEQSVGLAAVGRATEAGERVALTRGDYELWFRDGQARVRFPDGEEADVSFEPFTRDESGNVVVGQGGAVTLQPGRTYRFEARLTGPAADGPFSRALSLTSTGNVDAVRIVDGVPVLNVADQQIDPSNIIRIR